MILNLTILYIHYHNDIENFEKVYINSWYEEKNYCDQYIIRQYLYPLEIFHHY